jgi:hypothetical protein
MRAPARGIRNASRVNILIGETPGSRARKKSDPNHAAAERIATRSAERAPTVQQAAANRFRGNLAVDVE